MNKLSIQSLRGPLRILIFHFLLAHSCRGKSHINTALKSGLATVGDDIILPCHLDPAVDAAPMTLEWTRPDLKPNFVHVRRGGRTSLFINELKHGNISLKLSKVKLSDGGTYHCFIPKLDKRSSVELVVGKWTHTVFKYCRFVWSVHLVKNSGRVNMRRQSRGPDDLYTVSSRVTVEKRHSNSFTL
uniref:Ig-like domain-containing protein n=1 Tax=Lates calcarifer TaxID=8187 RepID=A0A4W6EFS9_LATCA